MKTGLREDERAPGTRVRLTGTFLKNTGQQVGGEGQSVWTIQECSCQLCRTGAFVATNEPHACQEDPRGYEDIPPEERPRWRHINTCNLQVVGGRPKISDYP